jgi:hypothetical protein
MNTKQKIEEILLNDFGCFDDFTVDKLLDLLDVVGRSEQLVCVGCGRTEKQHTGNGKDICPNNGGQFKAN